MALCDCGLQRTSRTRNADENLLCGDDAELRRRVAILLAAHEDAGSFLEKRPKELAATAGTEEGLSDWSGDAWHDLLEPKLKRTVAIKLLAPELAANRTSVRRFLREAQAATEFCAKLTEIDRDAGILSKDWEYRLPTETEWEYACRAGTSGATYGPLDSIAWHFGNSDLRPHPVGEKSPNPWGFYDMLGNVWAMCQDWFSVKRQLRACRGGSYFNTGKSCRAAARCFYMGGRYCGFRLAAAPVRPCGFCPSIEQYPAPPAKPSIFDAFDAKDYALAEQILADDPDQLEGVDDIPPSLHWCIYTDRPEMFEWLLDHGADIELREQDYGATPLNTAVVHRHKRIIRTLIERGADATRGVAAMDCALRGLAGAYEDDPRLDREGYREIIELLRELGDVSRLG
jgi:hypothetical protein